MTLDAYIAARSHARFDWGSMNCWFFACDWVALRIGRDPAAMLRGRFRTRFGLMRAIIEEGERDFLGMMQRGAANVGLESIGRRDLRAGDIAALQSDDGATGAIVTGRGFVGLGGDGIWWLANPTKVLDGWRVA